MHKYPRTHHIAGSKLQPGDEDLSQVAVSALAGAHLVIEEKLDGSNCGVSFGDDRTLLLQSRGHYLTGGPREKHFALFKTWAATFRAPLYDVLSSRYVMYGEWLYAKHCVYYDALPHWFMEFDVLDRESGRFLSTPARRQLLEPLPVQSVPVLREGTCPDVAALRALIRPSLYKTPQWRERLRGQIEAQGLDLERAESQTDRADLAEGLYLKHERDGEVVGRYKFIRSSFLQSVESSNSHWLNRPIIPNGLAPGVDILAGES